MAAFVTGETSNVQFEVPKAYQAFRDGWEKETLRRAYLRAYQQGQQSFVPNLLPELAVQLSGSEALGILREKLGSAVDTALDPAHSDPDNLSVTVPEAIKSPVVHQTDGTWLKFSNMVGINVRTVGSFWNIVKYAFTLPEAQNSIHILPIWEAGVVGSIYGLSSWEINPEFYSEELATICPALNTIEKQLRAVVNLLHAMGKAVGMDVIPHTDRYSQIALAFPQYFEWLQRQDTIIVDHSANLHLEVQEKIMDFLRAHGSAVPEEEIPSSAETFFSGAVDEARKLRILFGHPKAHKEREARRNKLIQYLYRYGYEPVPGTMAPPYRGLAVDTREEAKIVDEYGMVWRDYLITNPTSMSRVFGPLARYKLYESVDNNINWEIDFDKPRKQVWQYVCEKYYSVQRHFGFDFMRGDMSHVQMRPEGVPETINRYYDILSAVKNYIQQDKGVSHFGYFAETFVAPQNVMTYGDEMDHLEASDADTTLGDLQSTVVGSLNFLQQFRLYYDLLETRQCVPSFTVMTADKDDPRFDEFYLKGNEVRLFIALFLTDMPSYMGLGFETRDVHYESVPNEHYTKLFVFQERTGSKATHGPYTWGKNGFLFNRSTHMKLYLDSIWPTIKGRRVQWLLHPDPTGASKLIAWTQKSAAPDYVFVANLDTDKAAERLAIPRIRHLKNNKLLALEFTTAGAVPKSDRILAFNGRHYKFLGIAPGEGRVYRIK